MALLKGKSIEAQLYHRILDHIHDPDVRRLAHPGLILRKITKELIEEVLSGPCGVDVTRPGKSRELFSELSKEIALVEEPESGVLIHRPDLRALTLRMLLEDEKMLPVAREINEGAIRYYEQYDDSDGRAEELYHLLLFSVERSRFRWRPSDLAALGKVARSIDELPERGQAFVAARLNLELPPDQWTQAEDEDWILYASRSATQLLQVGKPFEALNALNRRRSVWEHRELKPIVKLVIDAVFHDYANQYEKIRETLPAGPSRTRRMSSLVYEIGNVAGDLEIESSYARKLFEEKRPGCRVVALGIIEKKPSPAHIDVAVEAIENAFSPFEQYHGLLVARMLFDRTTGEQRERLRQALLTQRGTPIHESDSSRADMKRALLTSLREDVSQPGFTEYGLVEMSVTAPVVFRDDPNERHGPFVVTRGQHELLLPPQFGIGIYPVTNEQFLSFVTDGGYLKDEYWEGGSARRAFLTQDKKTRGPSTWRSSKKYNSKQRNHPVAGLSYLEAKAFVRWLNHKYPGREWLWCLPSEDMWEISARSSKGFQYPWGSGFLQDHCNSIESDIKGTSEVTRFVEGNSLSGCAEMAGNVWEFVEGSGRIAPDRCVLRGGSFKNNQYEVKSYLRLVEVPLDHRPPDFGIRCAQIRRADEPADTGTRTNSSHRVQGVTAENEKMKKLVSGNPNLYRPKSLHTPDDRFPMNTNHEGNDRSNVLSEFIYPSLSEFGDRLFFADDKAQKRDESGDDSRYEGDGSSDDRSYD